MIRWVTRNWSARFRCAHICHSRAGGNPFIETLEARVNSQWIPACAGMTAREYSVRLTLELKQPAQNPPTKFNLHKM